jgi:uncharacterized protein YwgA
MEGLLALTRAFGGSIEGRLRIQKAAYLLKVLGAAEFSRTRFRYYYYGPYSRELSGSLQEAVAAGFLREDVEGLYDQSVRYHYSLSDKGLRWLEDVSTDVERRFAEKIPLLRQASQRALELAATIEFLEQEEQLNRRRAVERAVQLKPDCVSSRDLAEALLTDLGVTSRSSA